MMYSIQPTRTFLEVCQEPPLHIYANNRKDKLLYHSAIRLLDLHSILKKSDKFPNCLYMLYLLLLQIK